MSESQNPNDPVVFIYNLDGGGSCYFGYNGEEQTVEHFEQNGSGGKYAVVYDGAANTNRRLVTNVIGV